jgi:octaprenyl-diphosphate synthase
MVANRTFLDQFNVHLKRINDELSRNLNNHVFLIEDIGNHPLLGQGKRLRPLLFVMSCQLCGYQGEDIYHFSTIFEYIHTASLLYDDVLDNTEIRGNKPSANHVRGNSTAVLGVDFLSSKSFAIAVGSNNLEFLKILTDTKTRMTEGQALESIHTNNWHISRDEYMEIIISKTAGLISAACACGAIFAGAEKRAVDHLSQFGLNLGIAFQIMDDLLDYISCEEGFGKPIRKDLEEGKITLPLIYILSDLKRAEIERLEDLFKDHKAHDEDYRKLIAMVRNNGVIDRIRSEARVYVDKAASFLNFFPGSSVKENLMELNAELSSASLRNWNDGIMG